MVEHSLKSIKKELKAFKRRESKETNLQLAKSELEEFKRKKSIGGRITKRIQKGFEFGRKGLTKTLIERDRPLAEIERKRLQGLTKAGGIRTGRVGRPRGTVKFTDPRTGRPIGVFEHRKILAQQRKLELIKARRESFVTPRQQQVISSLEQKDRELQISQERRAIPGTSGKVQLMGIMEEIDIASNLVN